MRAFVINKFRGDQSLLRPGLERISELTGVPFWGVLPWLDEVWLDGEDTLRVGRWAADTDHGSGQSAHLADDVAVPEIQVAVVRFPRLSNATDVDALAAEPGVQVSMVTDPGRLRSADVIVLPGTRSTVADLAWLRARGLGAAVAERAAAGIPVIGICGGYQMLAGRIEDPEAVETAAGAVDGLGLLPVTVRFGARKVLATTTGTWAGTSVQAYEIHHGVATLDPQLSEDQVTQPFLGRLPAGIGVGNHLAWRFRERRVPKGLARRGHGGRRGAVHRRRLGTGFPGPAGGDDRRPGRCDLRQPGHRGAARRGRPIMTRRDGEVAA